MPAILCGSDAVCREKLVCLRCKLHTISCDLQMGPGRAKSQLESVKVLENNRREYMYLFLLALLVAVALAIWFVFISEAPVVAKVLIAILFVASFFLHPSAFPLAGFFLRIAIAVFVLFYQMYQAAKLQ